MRSLRTAVTGLALVLAACSPTGFGDTRALSAPPLDATISGQEARLLFGAERAASGGQGEVLGFYSRGCLAGAEQLPETGPTWQAMRLSRN
ncbi:MAG: penicillin-insensitive murein endopeptidase, partial [Roseicyclus sp.]